MKNNFKKSVKRKWIIMALLIVLVIAAAYLAGRFIYKYYRDEKIEENHKLIREFIDDKLKYEADDYEKYLDEIEKWVNSDFVRDSDKGLLYERESLIYLQQGDVLKYYEVLGYALYYLQREDVDDTFSNIYADLANSYIVDGSYDTAWKMMEKIQQHTSYEDIENLQVKSYVYRLLGILYANDGDYEKALDSIDSAQEYVDEANSDIWGMAYTGMDDVVRADIYFSQGKYQEAKAILDSYEGSELFDNTVFADVLRRDFVVPYYKVYAKYSAYIGDRVYAKGYIDKFMDISNESGYIRVELNTILYLVVNYPPQDDEARIGIYSKLNQLYTDLNDSQSDRYVLLLNEQLYASIDEIENSEKMQKIHESNRNTRVAFVVIFLVLLGLAGAVTKMCVTDGLTGIYNKRGFKIYYKFLYVLNRRYELIMFDLDDFKQINDRYGHETGDRVLEEFGKILKNMQRKHVRAFRFGGEEFVITLRNKEEKAAILLAEQVRLHAEHTLKMPDGRTITVSCGVAESDEGEDTLGIADKKLYYVKNHGKNGVAYTDKDGEVRLYDQVHNGA